MNAGAGLDPAAELRCAFESCILVDRSDLTRLVATGPDFLGLLHRLSTAAVGGLAPGTGRATVLTTPKGRIVERLFVHHLGPEGVAAVAGPASGRKILEHVARFTFAERTELREVTDETRLLALTGPRAAEALAAAGLPRPAAYGTAAGTVGGVGVHVLGHDGDSSHGLSVLAPLDGSAAVDEALARAVATVSGRRSGRDVAEAARVLRGVPAAGHELNEDHNPLEAGLWDAVDFDKGCYVGQEVVARLRTYDKVARRIVGLELAPEGELPAPGTPLTVEGRAIGELTSAVRLPGAGRAVGLGYVKRREAQLPRELRVGSAPGSPLARAVALPFDRPLSPAYTDGP